MRFGSNGKKTGPAWVESQPAEVREAMSLVDVAIGRLETDEAMAVEQARQAVNVAPDSPVILWRCANLVVSTSAWQEAEPWVARAADAAPADWPNQAAVLHLWGRVLALRGDFTQAHEKFSAAHDIDPGYDDGVLLADVCHRLGRIGEMETVVRAGLDGSPRNPALIDMRAWLIERGAWKRPAGP